jgi:hypothetical protein
MCKITCNFCLLGICDVALALFCFRELNSEHEATRIEALHWFSTLLVRNRTEVLENYAHLLDA